MILNQTTSISALLKYSFFKVDCCGGMVTVAFALRRYNRQAETDRARLSE
jgi:hypothetical protein